MIELDNVHDRIDQWIGTWEAEPIDEKSLGLDQAGRTVIYVDPHGKKERGVMTGYGQTSIVEGSHTYVSALFSQGDTSARCPIDRMYWGIRLIPIEELMSR